MSNYQTDSTADDRLKVMVLTGGPDRERQVSFMSAGEVAKALVDAGHDVRVEDVRPDDLSCFEKFVMWGGDVLFPALHGAWGEGGGLQHELDQRDLPYVGSRAEAARQCIDKDCTKRLLIRRRLPTPPFEMVRPDETASLAPPVVIKAPREGSSIDLVICRDEPQVQQARQTLHQRHQNLLVEQYICGKELTFAILDFPDPRKSQPRKGPPSHPRMFPRTLPPIQIVPATDFYDYEAKYTRNDTQYLFDPQVPAPLLEQMATMALESHSALGCRHLSRVDFMVDHAQQPWLIEVNTIPGFTSHSLLPMAAAQGGMTFPQLVDHLVRLPVRERRIVTH